MRLQSFTIVPLNLVNSQIRHAVEQEVCRARMHLHDELKLKEHLQEWGAKSIEVYHDNMATPHRVHSVFLGNCLCLIINCHFHKWRPSEVNVIKLLRARKVFHANVVRGESASPVSHILHRINDSARRFRHVVTPTYAFTIFSFEATGSLPDDEKELLKLLVEPSIVGLSDAASEQHPKHVTIGEDAKNRLGYIKDCDIHGACELYATWASLLTISYSKYTFAESARLGCALEILIQSSWNRIHHDTSVAESSIRKRLPYSRLVKLYWEQFFERFEVASLLGANMSARSRAIFAELVRTSEIEHEIDRHSAALKSLSEYINELRHTKKRYSDFAIQLLLATLAMLQVVALFLPIPLVSSRRIGALGIIFLAGTVFAILWKSYLARDQWEESLLKHSPEHIT